MYVYSRQRICGFGPFNALGDGEGGDKGTKSFGVRSSWSVLTARA